jgi:hypothetical protein
VSEDAGIDPRTAKTLRMGIQKCLWVTFCKQEKKAGRQEKI